MPDQKEIYNQHAEQYESLVSKEDYQGNILRALMEIHPFEGYNVVELGAGTGRLTRLLAPLANTIWALDISDHMLGVAARTLEAMGARNWKMAVADHRSIPLADGIADVVISGWSVGCLTAWSGRRWRKEISKVIGEIERVLQDKWSSGISTAFAEEPRWRF